MKPRFFVLLPSLFLVISAACTPPDNKTVEERSISPPTRPCPTTPTFAQSTLPHSTPSSQVGVAPTYQEIHSKLKDFDARLLADSPNFHSIKSEANSYLREVLYEKRVSGWEGWIVNTGIEALRAAEVPWRVGYDMDDDPELESPLSMLLVSTDDPFASAAPPSETPEPTFSVLDKPYILLTDVKESSGQQLCIGQRVSFEGYVSEPPEIIYSRGDIPVSGALVTVVDNALPERAVSSDLSDVMIKRSYSGSWGLPAYQLIVFGDGTVVFEGRYVGHTEVKGFRITTVSEDTIRQLLKEFEDADFFSMADFDEYGITDAPIARVTLVLNGKRKSVLHYYGNAMPAEKITHLENRIDELVGIEQWVTKP